jgi:hypothetical protein
MLIGTGGKKSKTEAVYCPTKVLGRGELPLINKDNTFTIKNEYISFFANIFHYLRSIINSDLRDIHEIKKNQKATKQMHELKHLSQNKHATEKGIKVWLYLALPPVNTLLWGCESWVISAEATRLLESFHAKSIRKILGITM